MKKILLAAVAALAIVGCSQNEEMRRLVKRRRLTLVR